MIYSVGSQESKAYIQHMDDFATSSLRVRNNYDVILFYTMLLDGPTDDGLEWYQGKPKSVLEDLGPNRSGNLYTSPLNFSL